MPNAFARFTPAHLALMVVSLAMALALGWINGLGRLDQTLIDLSAARQHRAIDPEIVIIAIDDPSITQLGRWPWPRKYHADLLARLRGARAIGLDIILAEQDAAANDEQLAQALRENGRVALPIFLAKQGGGIHLTLPLPIFAASAAALAHINTELDSDGLVRRVFLQEGDAQAPWPHLAVAMLEIGGQLPTPLPGARRPTLNRTSLDAAQNQSIWLRDYDLRLPLAGQPGSYPRYSYADVLNGKVKAEVFDGKYVLIGATATGLGDAYPTLMAGSQALMPGIELIANTLDTLRNHHSLRLAKPLENALLTVMVVCLALLALIRARPKWALTAVLSLMLATLLLAELAQSYLQIQFAPLAAIFILLLLYPLWSWLRMEAALRYFSDEMGKIRRQDPLLASLPQSGAGLDLLDQKMAALSHAVDQLSSLRRFVHDSLDQLADAVWVCDAHGQIILHNQAAQQVFPTPCLESALLPRLQTLIPQVPMIADLLSDQGGSWRASDAQGRDVLLKSVVRRSESGDMLGWIISLIDLSLVQAAQRQRDEALDFLSHDMRSPQSAILALLTLHQSQNPAPDLASQTLYARIAAHAQRTLQLADDFVQLARANSASYHIEPSDLLDLMYETCDQFWEKAQLQQLKINSISHLSDADLAIYPADRQMLGRALGNLIDNALKYGSTGPVIDCSIAMTDRYEIELAVQDYGVGIASDQQDQLLAKFTQAAGRSNGVGLGLAFVKAVAERHHGKVVIQSALGQGSRFSILLPQVKP